MYGLRERKRTKDVTKQYSDLSENPSSESEKSEDEDSKHEDSKEEDSDSSSEPKKTDSPKPKKRAKHGKYNKTIKEEEKPFISEYEKIRLQSIAERNELLRSMGINVSENISSAKPKKPREVKKVKKEKVKEDAPVRMSLRLRGKTAEKVSDAFVDESFSKEPEPDIDTRNLGRWARGRQIFGERAYEDIKSRTGRTSILPRKYFE